MTRQSILDLYFMDARSKLIDIAAFLDRVDRGEGEPDFRLAAFRKALEELQHGERLQFCLNRLRQHNPGGFLRGCASDKKWFVSRTAYLSSGLKSL